MADSTIQQIKDKLDIVEVVSSYIKLQKTGINYRATCPFHKEKKPSFFVSPARQSFKCFGCNRGGSIFDFVMEIEGIEFGDALRLLARRAGVELKTFRPELQTKRQRLYEICEIASKFFEKQLQQSSRGREVKKYLLERGLTEETIKKWRLGYAPDTWQGLSDFLIGKGYKRDEIVQAGLAVQKEGETSPPALLRKANRAGSFHSYDRFRGRIMFPVFDLHSQVIGFGGRVFGEEEEVAKYVNIPNTLLYDKSRVLYGLNFAKMDIRKKDGCILSEGYTDVILSHQAGFANTVASSGTALTPQQLLVLKRYTSNLLFAFDMDTAGGLATKRGIDLAQQQDFEVRVICMPKDTDPADIIAQNPKKWEKLSTEAKEVMAFYFDNALDKFDQESPQGKKEIAKALLPAIKRVPNKILQSHWLQKLANVLKVSEEAILEEIKKITRREPSVPETLPAQGTEAAALPPKTKAKQRQDLLEEKILSLLLKEPKNLDLIDKDCLDCFSPPLKTILANFKKVKVPEKLKIKEQELEEILTGCMFRAEIDDEQDKALEIKLCLAQLRTLQTKNKLEQISKEIKMAEEKGDEKKVKDLMHKFNQLATYAKNKT